MFTIANLHIVLEVVGALSTFCGVMSHVIPGKAGAVLGEIGVDLMGVLTELGK